MKNIVRIVIIYFLTLWSSCDYLDVVPNDTATLDHAFSNRAVTARFLATCYSHIPDITNPFYYPAWFNSRDEMDYVEEYRVGNTVAGLISQGLQNADGPYQDYWSGRRGGKAMYTAIRECNIFLNNVHIPRDIQEEERTRWIAEVKFLKAYYHFFLMQLYGPIVIADKEIPISSSPEALQVYREPFDECVDYVLKLLDEAIPDLPLVLPDPASEQGRITKLIALSVKAKVLTLAASPLFNGNSDYKNWKDNRGKYLISSEYNLSKWEKAARAIKEAIDACHEGGLRLYTFNRYSGGPKTYNMNDSLVQLMTIRKAVTEDLENNTGVIWASQENFELNKGGSSYYILGDMLRSVFPPIHQFDASEGLYYYFASWHMAELFYTNNGVPIDEDKYYDYAGRFSIQRVTPGDNHQFYIPTGETTVKLHLNREARFYADLGFDRGFFEIATTTENGGASFSPFLTLRLGEKSDRVASGYVPKKIIAFNTSATQGDVHKHYTPYHYRFPLIRLADLYLLYSEALNEMKEQPDSEVYFWIDQIRNNAGLKGVLESWQNFSNKPERPTTKNGMRSIIQKERLIELAFEGQRFWDVRRWKLIDKYWTLTPTRWTSKKNPEEYYIPERYTFARKVTYRDYLYPIATIDLRINSNLVQTYGW